MLVDLDIARQETVLSGRPFGTTGSYKQLYGSAVFEVDPLSDANRRVVDIGLAPRNADGKVECQADIWILRPTDATKGNGALLYHVVNRGRKGAMAMYNLAEGSNAPISEAHFGDGFLLEQGYTIAAVAWQADVPPDTPDDGNLMTMDVPIATEGAARITGPVGCEIIVDEPCDLHTLGSRYHIPYEVAEGSKPEACLTVREKPYDAHEQIPSSAWSFDRMPDGRPAIRYAAGFEPGKIYNLVYTGIDPKVMGLGFVTTRDFVSTLKYDTDRFACLKNQTRIARAHAFGSSQSGRFLRHFLYEGFNEDEQHRKIFDGLVVNVAGGAFGSFNHRFAQPSRHASAHFDVYYPTEQFPFTDLPQTDPVTNQTKGLLDRCEDTGTVPRIFYSNTSTEYWNRSASLTHTDLSGTEDAEVHPSVRIYHFAGTQHGPADFPPGDETLPGNPVNFRLGHRALLVALDKWVDEGQEPPESQHGRIADNTLVSLDYIGKKWPKMALDLPTHPRDPRRLDHGPSWETSGVISTEPPVPGERYGLLLPAIDEDGNEICGIRLPEVAVPLGTFTGWSLRPAETGATWAVIGLKGFWHPFPLGPTESDGRNSISQRYPNQEDYIARCVAVADKLIADRYLLERDRDLIRQRSANMYAWVNG